MALRIFYIIVAIVIGLLLFDLLYAYSSRGDVNDVPPGYAIGPENADLTVVEFLDYSCVHCRKVHPVIMEAIRRDGNIRYIPRPIPLMVDNSIIGAIAAYTAGEQGKFFEMHELLITHDAPLNVQTLTGFAQSLDLNTAAFSSITTELPEGKVRDHISDGVKYFYQYEGRGTPMFVLNGKHVYYTSSADPTVEEFLDVFKRARLK